LDRRLHLLTSLFRNICTYSLHFANIILRILQGAKKSENLPRSQTPAVAFDVLWFCNGANCLNSELFTSSALLYWKPALLKQHMGNVRPFSIT